MIRKLLPKQTRLLIKIMFNYLLDIKNGYIFKFAQKRNQPFDLKSSVKITQNLKPNNAKLHNLFIAKNAIENLIIMPDEIFSFWKTIGAPTTSNGFRPSRSIINNEVKNSIGGGLCQLSGLIYYISLKSGLEIIERHNHSIDIYQENTRFAPIGSDATLVYGYKDLRIKNNLNSPLEFKFIFETDKLTIKLNTKGEIPIYEIGFKKMKLSPSKIEITTFVEGKVFDKSIYKKPCTKQ